MNLRCSYCQTPFTIGRSQMLVALQLLRDENLHHYDAHCPRCRKANQISRDRLEHFFPNWQEVLAASAETPEQAAPVEPKPAAKADKKPATSKSVRAATKK